MPYDPNRHHRRSIRLHGYDYRRPGAYFVTICVHGRQRLFGTIDGDALRPNQAGQMVARWWYALGTKFTAVIPDAFVVMPDHFHGIVVIVASDGDGDDVNVGGYANPPPHGDTDDSSMDFVDSIDNTSVGADSYIRPRRNANDPNDRIADNADNDSTAVSLSQVIQWFKIMTTTEYIRQVKRSGWPAFDRRVWQRGYYEHIIRDDESLGRLRRYIEANPARWAARRDDLDALLARMEWRNR